MKEHCFNSDQQNIISIAGCTITLNMAVLGIDYHHPTSIKVIVVLLQDVLTNNQSNPYFTPYTYSTALPAKFLTS